MRVFWVEKCDFLTVCVNVCGSVCCMWMTFGGDSQGVRNGLFGGAKESFPYCERGFSEVWNRLFRMAERALWRG